MSHGANLEVLSDEQRRLLEYAERVQREATELASGLRARMKRRGSDGSSSAAGPLQAANANEPIHGCGNGNLMSLGEQTVSAAAPVAFDVEATAPDHDPPEITASHFEMLPTPLPVRQERAGAQRRKSLYADQPNLDDEALRAVHITHFSVTLPLRWWQRRALRPYFVAAAACLATVLLGMLLSIGNGHDEVAASAVAEPVATIEELVGPPTPAPEALSAALNELEARKAKEPVRRVVKRGARHQRR